MADSVRPKDPSWMRHE